MPMFVCIVPFAKITNSDLKAEQIKIKNQDLKASFRMILPFYHVTIGIHLSHQQNIQLHLTPEMMFLCKQRPPTASGVSSNIPITILSSSDSYMQYHIH